MSLKLQKAVAQLMDYRHRLSPFDASNTAPFHRVPLKCHRPLEVPYTDFVDRFLDRHPEYRDLRPDLCRTSSFPMTCVRHDLWQQGY